MLRRSWITMSDAEPQVFLTGERVVTCATIGPNGRPHLTPLWSWDHRKLGAAS